MFPNVILVVDDERDLTATCERLLRRLGYRVMTADSCAAALAALGGEPPVLVISDVRLPDGNGLDVVSAARRRTTPIPSIVITGQPSERGRQAAADVGATGYLAKPFSAAALTELVRRTLGPQA
ncbi:MAG TPA: response regulator [Candidatus Limnocylindria bacterium]|nr:response regulator [Candidatus Limnocylindria bacterium]